MPPPRDPRLVLLERLGVALLLLAAIVPRARDLTAPFDRGFDGFQGTFFAIGAVNYERLGVGLHGGYPVYQLDLPEEDPSSAPAVYANHPPLVPLLAWASLKALGPDGWNEAWRDGRPPEDFEGALRLPFFLLHLFGLFALWWAVRQGQGPQPALLALAIASVLPLSITYAGLVNYENVALGTLVLGAGLHVRWLRTGRPLTLGLAALLLFLSSCATFTALFFVPGLVLQAFARRGLRRGLLSAAVLGAGALLPILLHGLWVRAALPDLQSETVWTRAETLLAPLFDGSAPFTEWIRRQWVRAQAHWTLPILLAACGGLAIALWRAWARRPRPDATPDPEAPISLALPFASGGFLALFAFYRHTYDGAGADDGQTVLLLNAAPACAVLAAQLLDALGRPLLRLKGGFAPLVLLVFTLALPATMRANEIRSRLRDPGPRDDPPVAAGHDVPLPKTAGERIAEVLPAGAIGLVPRAMGTTLPTGFYAWRTLLGVDEENWELRLATIDALGLGDRPRYILLPVDPPEAARAFAHRHRTNLEAKFGVPVAANETWEIWPPEP